MPNMMPATWVSIQKLLSRHSYGTLPAHALPASCVPQEVWDADDGYVCLEIRRGLHGLKEAGILAFNQLVKKLAPHGCKRMPFTPGLWRHCIKCTTFALCVDDFGVKCFSKANAQHLIDALDAHYKLTINGDGALCCGLTLDWCQMVHCLHHVESHSPQSLTEHPIQISGLW
jgi:hypothetical protein